MANPLVLNGGTLQGTNGWGQSWNGPITLAATSTVNAQYGMTFSNVVSGSGGLIVTRRRPTDALRAANTYSGGTTLVARHAAVRLARKPGQRQCHLPGRHAAVSTGVRAFSIDVSGRINPIGSGQAAIIDTNGNDVSFGTPIGGEGGLTKQVRARLRSRFRTPLRASPRSTAVRCNWATAPAATTARWPTAWRWHYHRRRHGSSAVFGSADAGCSQSLSGRVSLAT